MYCGLKVIVVGSVVHGSSCCFCLSFFAWHRHGFAVCASLFLQLCVQLGMYASPRYVTIPTPPTHPTPTQRYVCVCTIGNVCKSKVCYHPPPHPPTHPNPKVCVCVCSWECMQVQGMLPSPPHPPTHPKSMCVCACVYR